MNNEPPYDRRAQLRYRRLIEKLPGSIVFVLDPGLHVTYAGGSMATSSAFDPAAYLGRAVQDFTPTSILATITPCLEATLQGQETSFELTSSTGAIFQAHTAPLEDDDGCIEEILVIALEITPRRRAEAAELAAQQRLQLAVQAANVGLWDWDVPSKRVHFSPEWKRQLGYTEHEVGDELWEWEQRIHPDDLPHVRAAVAGYGAAPPASYSHEYRMRHKDGSYRWMLSQGTLYLDASGTVVRMLGAHIDITAKKHAEEELRADNAARKLRELEHEELLRQIEDKAEQLAQVMESAPAGVLLLDNLNCVLLTNKRAADKLALLATYDADERLAQLGGVNIEVLLAAPPAGQWHMLQVGRLTYAVIAHPVESGSLPSGWAMVVRDVTAEREVREQLQRQERLAAVGQLAAGIAHDFNNIMSVISIYAELASEAQGLADHERARMRTIMAQAQRATRMIRQILDFSRQSVFERKLLDLLPLLNEQSKLLQETLPENIEVTLIAAQGEYLVLADATRIQQLVMNLAVNARDAMADGGRLHIELQRMAIQAPAKLPVPGMADGEWIQVIVGDTGHGIPADHLPRIFEPFFTTKDPGKGTGLGLAQVHGIVAQHDGHITVASEPAAGTIFTVYLPAVAAPPPQDTAPVPHAAPLGSGECVLLVEDDAAVRTSLAALLEQWNYRVVEAANGQEALACLARPWRHVDVILSDVVMPRLGGVGLVKVLRRDGVEVPVILMSGHAAAAERLGLPEAGVQGWVDKPPSSWQLAHALAKALGKL